METETFAALTASEHSLGRRRSQAEVRRRGTHRANHDGSPKPGGENRIVWKCMAELGISGGATVGSERSMPSTNRALAFGEK